MDDNDPITQFFPDDPDVDLYSVFGVESSASTDEIKKAYRKLALIHHPDKHATSGEEAKAAAQLKFQQIGFAYTVLGDEKRRKRYDATGRTDEGLDFDKDEAGWEAYFEELFDKVTRGKLDEMKKEYQGSDEEIQDLKEAYELTKGDIGEIMNHIPHSTHEDESRFIVIIADLIRKGVLKSSRLWEKSSKDEKARLIRKKQADKEAAEAETLAKELGVWDEFYGSGKAGARNKDKKKGKAAPKGEADDEDGDTAALQALILAKKKKMDSFLDNLAEKYAEPEKKKGKGRKGKRPVEEDIEEETDVSPKKKRRAAEPDINDDEFAKLQEKLFGDKAKSAGTEKKSGKTRRGRA
ncbi:DnaJ-domain-containing protein [Punctularia strigosozonata HHB-11173 SS5]|uniref:DnaJ-domain-containing protein n=1 Tax=Punctularia strigosozonata (strain HHB-11173) TaxID=741275 RepID=UPI0004416E0F|nr:DnaJ-domain-containing protein [Punctularia strigosozonata HHB-11173 SS5]EIN07377.1 DnaJ-domain-containing protein [Punctularia strigosozonata HHB-11173 SS5]